MKLSDYNLAFPILAIVHLDLEPNPLSLQQVVLRPDKITAGLIRLGETQGDEALCWQRLENIEIVHILGKATEGENNKWTCSPILDKAA